jgi:predicted nucleotidyltransferase
MSSRQEIAREAARILYNRSVKEYKDAKDMAASNLDTKALPSNYEVAIELDRLTEELEGSNRLNRLVEMRTIALELMRALRDHDPVLIGSVWRGTVRKGSDIDIVVYSQDPELVEDKVREVYSVIREDNKTFTINGRPRSSIHIYFQEGDHKGEIVIRPAEDRDFYKNERCETYGDIKKGLTLDELEKLMSADPFRRFIPKRRNK